MTTVLGPQHNTSSCFLNQRVVNNHRSQRATTIDSYFNVAAAVSKHSHPQDICLLSRNNNAGAAAAHDDDNDDDDDDNGALNPTSTPTANTLDSFSSLPSRGAIQPIVLPSSSNLQKNLVHQLFYRSLGGKQHQRGMSLFLQPPLPIWKQVSHVELVTSTTCHRGWHDDAASRPNGRNHTVMAWDTMGMLLATASREGILSIFDWDVVLASHMQATSHASRATSSSNSNKNGGNPTNHNSSNHDIMMRTMIHSVPPMVQFKVPHIVHSLQWNPYDPDMLAVAFR
jgi:hypothetical protein